FGQTSANQLRRRRPRPGDQGHLDEVFITILGKTHYLGRAVDQDGTVLDMLVTSRRDATAATRFFRTLLRGWRSVPRVLVTDCRPPRSWDHSERFSATGMGPPGCQ
ncbi:MAG: DDE-type integrase/transposase/recombinase, partial [Pseudonocardiaceae bacterium]